MSASVWPVHVRLTPGCVTLRGALRLPFTGDDLTSLLRQGPEVGERKIKTKLKKQKKEKPTTNIIIEKIIINSFAGDFF